MAECLGAWWRARAEVMQSSTTFISKACSVADTAWVQTPSVDSTCSGSRAPPLALRTVSSPAAGAAENPAQATLSPGCFPLDRVCLFLEMRPLGQCPVSVMIFTVSPVFSPRPGAVWSPRDTILISMSCGMAWRRPCCAWSPPPPLCVPTLVTAA